VTTVSVRYIVTDVAEAIDFYCRHLGFREDMHPAPTFAMLSRGDLRLVLSAPGRLEEERHPQGTAQDWLSVRHEVARGPMPGRPR
jgi:catechol 2,3-dioxygenase-like lactoylglutathione lyase family enzyme